MKAKRNFIQLTCQQLKPSARLFRLSPYAFRLLTASLLLIITLAAVWPAFGQKKRRKYPRTRPRIVAPAPRPSVDTVLARQRAEQAMGIVCAERARDPLGSVPIDEMQARASLELNHPEAVIGVQRAQRLLPIARELVVEALRQLAAEYKIRPLQVRLAAQRVRAVREIIPDPDLRDNAAVIMSDPNTIRFGTIFLVGLPSDEGMISVLAHELTHIADGRQNSLHPLFNLIGRRAAQLTAMRINGQKPEELTCDLVGVRVARTFVARTPNREPLSQRLARALEHNCVDSDDTDDEHLSPRSTMRAVLALDPTFTRGLITHEDQAGERFDFRQFKYSGELP
jgi:hypothetical protein